MQKPLDPSHFRAAKPPALLNQPSVQQLAVHAGEACLRSLMQLRPSGWTVALDRVTDASEAPRISLGKSNRLESERGSLAVHIQLDQQAISSVTEAAFGGTGAEQAFLNAEKPLSNLEKSLLNMLEDTLLAELATVFSSHFSRDFSSFRDAGATPGRTSTSEFIQFCYVINIFSYSGELILTLPSNDLRRQLSEHANEISTAGTEDSIQNYRNELSKSTVLLTVTLAGENFPLDRISSLKKGELLELQAQTSSAVTVWSGNIESFEGRLARQGDRLAVLISSVKD